METVLVEMAHGSYGNRYDEYDDEEMMGERRGVRGSGRGRRRR